MTLVIGGARSGKSEFAERFATSRRKNRLFYVATLLHDGEEENFERIKRHQATREGRPFETIELFSPDELDLWSGNMSSDERPVVLLDCLGIMLSQGKYVESDGVKWTEIENEDVERSVMRALKKLAHKAEDLVIVAPDIFKAQAPDASTDRYMQLLGRVLQAIVKTLEASLVEVIAGVPVIRRDQSGVLTHFANRMSGSCRDAR